MSTDKQDEIIAGVKAGVTEAMLTRSETHGGRTIYYTQHRVRREVLAAIQSGVRDFLEANKDLIVSAIARQQNESANPNR